MSLQLKTHSSNPLPWLVALMMGVLLVALAIPGLVSLYTARSVPAFVKDLDISANDQSGEQLAAAVQQMRSALELEPGRRQHANVQVILLLRLYYQHKSARREGEAAKVLRQANTSVTKSLRRAPGDANLWYLLAEIRALQNAMDDKTRRILAMSYLSGPREGWIALRRLQFSLRYWLLLDNGLRRHAKKEISSLWSEHRFQRPLIRQFATSSKRSQRLLYAQIKTHGGEAEIKFRILAKKAGWKAVFLNLAE